MITYVPAHLSRTNIHVSLIGDSKMVFSEWWGLPWRAHVAALKNDTKFTVSLKGLLSLLLLLLCMQKRQIWSFKKGPYPRWWIYNCVSTFQPLCVALEQMQSLKRTILVLHLTIFFYRFGYVWNWFASCFNLFSLCRKSLFGRLTQFLLFPWM